jgi:hypothetical protein
MEEFITIDSSENKPGRGEYPPVWQVLAVQLGLFIGFYMAGNLLFLLLATATGWGVEMPSADMTAAQRWHVRIMLGLTHFTGFALSGLATVWVFYRSRWKEYIKVGRMPDWQNLGYAVLLMLVSIPLTLYLYNFNKGLPLPDVFREMESQSAEALKGLLKMDDPGELLANLFLIALLPAIGEELVFRGVVQQQLMRSIRNPWVGIFVASAIFSFIHFQFEGFIPRLMLGFFLGILYWETRNFWVCAAAHFFNNGIQVLGQYLYSKQITGVDMEKDVEVPAYMALISALLIAVIWRQLTLHNKRTSNL